jgi:hypothetical protein
MKLVFHQSIVSVVAVAALSLTLAGCAEPETAAPEATTVAGEPSVAADQSHDDHDEHQHGGWWCGPHGVPEAECARCDKSLVAEFKAKEDWCDEHNRPDSQCFICNPDSFEKYATLYEAKFGERPAMPKQ